MSFNLLVEPIQIDEKLPNIIEYSSGKFTGNLEYKFQNVNDIIHKLGIIRTARLLSKDGLCFRMKAHL